MPADNHCPECSQPLTRVGKHWICPEHGQVSSSSSRGDEAQTALHPLRIFLSYGHDANEELVRRIYADLKMRGHDVWFDKHEIKFGDEWRRSITDGILQSHRVLSFLSKHSTRDPGVCRDEIAIAIGVKGGNIQTILVESEQEVQPPVSIGHIQWLDMHDWKERCSAGEAAWEPWYQAKLAEIVRVVESDESRRFAGEIETLNRHLKPIKSEARICQLLSKGFYGRQWLFEAVENWRSAGLRTGSTENQQRAGSENGALSRLFWIMGAPGVGKSAFAAQLTHTRGDTVVAAQFCEWDKPDHRNAARVVSSLAFQLATRLPDYRKLLLTLPEIAELDRKDAAELFDYLLANPLRSVIHGGRERVLIVIDALDEAGEAGRNPLVEMLARNAQRLPDWLGLVVTSRPEFDVKTPLQALNPFPLDTRSESNRADLRDYLRRELATPLQNRPDADRLVEQILEKSEGVFLYVERFCDDVQHGHLSLDRPEQFPQGLGGIFCQYFQRQFPDLEKFRKDVRPALRAILAAREPLPVEILQRLFHWQDEELRDFTRTLGSLFPVSGEPGHEVIKPYHKSLADWLADDVKAGPHFVSVLEGHRALSLCGWQQYEHGPETMENFFLQWLPSHLLNLGDDERLAKALADFRYLMEKARRGMLEQLLMDYRQLPARFTNAGATLEIAAAFFREKAHILRRGNEEWPLHKILLQLAVEHADDSPLTMGAEKWLAENRCDWLWFRRVTRMTSVQRNPCLAVLEGHTGPVEGAMVLSDGRLLSWSEDGTLRLWAPESNQCIAVLQGHTGALTSATLLSDGRLLTWCSVDDYTIRIWDVGTGKCLVIEEDSWVEGAMELDDGRLASWSTTRRLRFWDAHTGNCLAEVKPLRGYVERILKLTCNRLLVWARGTLQLWKIEPGDGSLRLWGTMAQLGSAQELANSRVICWTDHNSTDCTMVVRDLTNGAPLARLCGHTSSVMGMKELPNGQLLSWAWDGSLRLWDSQKASCLSVMECPTGAIVGATSLPDNRVLSWGHDSALRIWDGPTGKCLHLLEGHSGIVLGTLLLANGHFVSWGGDGVLRWWDDRAGQCLAEFNGHCASIIGALATPEGHLLSWSADSTLRRWNLNGCAQAREDQCNSSSQARFLTDDTLLTWSDAFPSKDYALRLWNTQSGACLSVLKGHTGLVSHAMQLGEEQVISWSQDGTIRLWNVHTGACVAILEGHAKAVAGVLDLNKGRLLSWSEDGTLRLWNLPAGSCMAVMKVRHSVPMHVMKLNSDRVISWAECGPFDKHFCTIDLWDSRTGEHLAEMGHPTKMAGLARQAFRLLPVSQDHLVCWFNDGNIWLWENKSGTAVTAFKCHQYEMHGALVLAEEKLLSWGQDSLYSSERELRLWDCLSGTRLATCSGHTGEILGVKRLNDGGKVVSWARDHTLRLWDAPSSRCLAVFRGHSESIQGVLEWGYGQLLSWSSDKTFRLWSGSGTCLEVVADMDVAIRHPEWLLAVQKERSPELIKEEFFWITSKFAGELLHHSFGAKLALWNGESFLSAKCLLADGTVTVLEERGVLCILKLHHGHRRVSLSEAEALLDQKHVAD